MDKLAAIEAHQFGIRNMDPALGNDRTRPSPAHRFPSADFRPLVWKVFRRPVSFHAPSRFGLQNCGQSAARTAAAKSNIRVNTNASALPEDDWLYVQTSLAMRVPLVLHNGEVHISPPLSRLSAHKACILASL